MPQLSDKEAVKRGVKVGSYYKKARERYARRKHGEGATWGGRRYNKQADPIVRKKTYPGAKAEHTQRFTTEKKFGLTRGKVK